MDVRLDEGAMNALVAKAVFDGMTPEKREALIQGAITALLEPTPRTQYSGDTRSKLQKAFDDAVYTAARQHAENSLSTDPLFTERLKALFADAAEKLFAEERRDELVTTIAHTIRSALQKDRY